MTVRLFARTYTGIFLCIFFTCLSFLRAIPVAGQSVKSKSSVSKKNPKRVLYGRASFYANKFNGRKTASGEIFSQNKLTCACNVLPLGTWIRVSNVRNGKSVLVKVNDRLHPKMNRIVDLTKAAAIKLGYVGAGLARVKVEVIGKKKPVV